MATKLKTLEVKNIKTVGSSRKGKGVTEFATFAGEDTNRHMADFDGQTIYIVKLERKFSDTYGDGFVVIFGDMPNAAAKYTAGVFGQYPAAQLEKVFVNSHEGRLISLDNPVRTTIRKIGNSYKFE
jgi:hypothetical protein